MSILIGFLKYLLTAINWAEILVGAVFGFIVGKFPTLRERQKNYMILRRKTLRQKTLNDPSLSTWIISQHDLHQLLLVDGKTYPFLTSSLLQCDIKDPDENGFISFKPIKSELKIK